MKAQLALVFILVCVTAMAQEGQSSGYQAAIDKYTYQIKTNPAAEQMSYLQRGMTYYFGRDYKKALDDLTRASGKLDPANKIKATYYGALCLEELGENFTANKSFASVLRTLNESAKIDGIISWENVLERKIANARKMNLPYATVSDLKTFASLKKDDAKVKAEINTLYEQNKIFAALDVNIFRIVDVGVSRKTQLAQEYFEDGSYAQAVTELTTEIQRETPKVDEALLQRGYVYLAMSNFKAAATDLEAVTVKTTSFNYKGLAAFYSSFAKEGMADGAGSLAAIRIANNFFTSDRSLVPASVVQKQLQTLDIPENRSGVASNTQKPTETKTIELATEKKSTEVITKKEEPPPPKVETQAAKTVEPEKKTAEPTDPVQKLTNSIKNAPTNYVLYFQRGMAYFQKGAPTEALNDFLFVYNAGETQLKSQSTYYITQCYAKMGGREDAIRYANQLLATLPADEKVVLNIGRDEILSQRAEWRLKSGRTMEAAMDFNKLTSKPVLGVRAVKVIDSLKGAFPVYSFSTYDAFEYSKDKLTKRLLTARQYYLDGMFDLAIESAAGDITTDPVQSSTALLVRGFLFLMSEKFGNAEKDFLPCTTSPVINQRGLAQFYLSLSYQQLGQVDDAINALTESMKVFTSNTSLLPESTLRLKRAELFDKQGFLEMAVSDYQKYLEYKPGDSKVRSRYETIRKSIPAGGGAPPVVVAEDKKPEQKKEAAPSLRDAFKGEKRYALVIGNANYPKEIGLLSNPVHDATDLKKELEASDFEVELLTDVTFRQVDIAAKRFYEKLSNGPKGQTVGLFYYSGHGLQFEGENYMVPLDAAVSVPGDIRYTCFPVDRVLTNMEYANARMNIVILDACRSNALPVVSRSTEAGLAQLRAAKGSYVAFSTAPGSTASDGTGRNGLYTQELLKALRKPQLTIEQVFKEVRKNVRDLSSGKQETWDNSNIVGEFYFKLD